MSLFYRKLKTSPPLRAWSSSTILVFSLIGLGPSLLSSQINGSHAAFLPARSLPSNLPPSARKLRSRMKTTTFSTPAVSAKENLRHCLFCFLFPSTSPTTPDISLHRNHRARFLPSTAHEWFRVLFFLAPPLSFRVSPWADDNSFEHQPGSS